MANQHGGPAAPATNPATSGRRAVVGPASALRGQLSAREDLWIDGQLDGEVQALAHQVTIGSGGRVRAEVRARSVVVEGELHGNVVASQMVTVRTGGRLQGDIRAPRVALEEGCQFQGHVDMDGTQTASTPEATLPASDAGPPASGGEPAETPATPALVGERNG